MANDIQSIETIRCFLQDYKEIVLHFDNSDRDEIGKRYISLRDEVYICDLIVDTNTILTTSIHWNGKSRQFGRTYADLSSLLNFLDSVGLGHEKDYPCYTLTTFIRKFRDCCERLKLISQAFKITNIHDISPLFRGLHTSNWIGEKVYDMHTPDKLIATVVFEQGCELWKCAALPANKCYPWRVRILWLSNELTIVEDLTIAEICEMIYLSLHVLRHSSTIVSSYKLYKENIAKMAEEDLPEDVLAQIITDYEEDAKKKSDIERHIMERNIEITKKSIGQTGIPVEAGDDSDNEFLNMLE